MPNKATFRESLIELFGVLTIASMILWFCQDLIVSEQVPFFRDLSTYFYPLRFVLYENFRSGELPLWDRHTAMGFPFLAAFQSGVFYPPHLFLLILPFFPAIRFIYVFHFLIAGIGAYSLCRSWRYPCYFSILGALLFALGGTVISLSNLLNHFQAAVWLPWVILSWEKLLCSFRWKKFLAFTSITAIQFLAGSPELFAMSMVLVFLDGVRIRGYVPELSYFKALCVFLAAILMVLALVMAQLLPTAELFLESRRQQPIPPQEALHWSLNPLSLLNFFFLDKEIDSSESIGIRLYFARAAPLFVSYYLGAISVLGISVWLCFSSIREKITLLGLVAASLVVAMGIHTPIYPFLFRHIPILGAFRFPEKVFFFTYALLLYMVLRGLGDLLLHDAGSAKKPLVVLAAVCAVLAGLYLFLRFNVDFLARFIAAQTGSPLASPAHANMVASVLSNLERQVSLSIGFLMLIALAKFNAIRTSLFGILAVSAVFVDLAWAHRSFLFPLSPDFVNAGTRIKRGPDAVLNRVFYYPSAQNVHPSFISVLGRPPFPEATALSFQNLLPNTGVFYGFDYMQEIDALARQPYTDFVAFANQLDSGRQLQLLRTFNVKYLVTFRPLSESGVTLVGHFPQHFSWLYSIDGTLPRTYVVGKAVVEKKSEQVLRRLSTVGFDPTQEVILDEEIALKPKLPLEATARIVRNENKVVTIQASTNDDGILILADSYYPGWKAYVDGKEDIIRRANLFFRAVSLPSGSHVVEFRYEPRSFKIGLIVSLVTVLCIVIVSVLVFMKKPKGPADNSVIDLTNPWELRPRGSA
jgi:hypothetical protein